MVPRELRTAATRFLRLAVPEFELRLSGSQPGHGYPVGRAGNVVQTTGAEEADGVGVAAVLAADTDLELGVRSSSLVRSQPDELADTLLVDRLEGILGKDLLVDVLGKEGAGVVPRVAERHLREVVCAEREEFRGFAQLL